MEDFATRWPRGWGTLAEVSLHSDLRVTVSMDQVRRANIPDVPCPGVGLFDHFVCPRVGI